MKTWAATGDLAARCSYVAGCGWRGCSLLLGLAAILSKIILANLHKMQGTKGKTHQDESGASVQSRRLSEWHSS